jgi:cob(I)alamin adenosyltransferase
MKIYTRRGDDGTTGLLYGGRVPKDSALPRAYGAVDEAQAAIGLVRAEATQDGRLHEILTHIARDLWVLMAELATNPDQHARLEPGTSRVTAEMVTWLEQQIDGITEEFSPPAQFVVPGQTRIAALLDVARTVVRRAEREALGAASDASYVGAYLNRLSDLLWMLARWSEDESLETRSVHP